MAQILRRAEQSREGGREGKSNEEQRRATKSNENATRMQRECNSVLVKRSGAPVASGEGLPALLFHPCLDVRHGRPTPVVHLHNGAAHLSQVPIVSRTSSPPTCRNSSGKSPARIADTQQYMYMYIYIYIYIYIYLQHLGSCWQGKAGKPPHALSISLCLAQPVVTTAPVPLTIQRVGGSCLSCPPLCRLPSLLPLPICADCADVLVLGPTNTRHGSSLSQGAGMGMPQRPQEPMPTNLSLSRGKHRWWVSYAGRPCTKVLDRVHLLADDA